MSNVSVAPRGEALFGFLTFQRFLTGLFLLGMTYLMVQHPALAASGMDTGTQTWNAVHTWLSRWVPIACGAVIVVLGVGWGVFHAIPGSFAGRAIIGMLIAGSASYIVSLTGLGN